MCKATEISHKQGYTNSFENLVKTTWIPYRKDETPYQRDLILPVRTIDTASTDIPNKPYFLILLFRSCITVFKNIS